MLVLLALPPLVVVYGFALRFLDATIDNWFNVKLEQALDNALEVGRIVVDERLRDAEQASAGLASRLAAASAAETQAIIDDDIDQLGATQLTVFFADGRVQATTSSDPRYLDPPLPDAAMQMRVQSDGRYAAAEPIGNLLVLRTAIPISGDVPGSRRLLQGFVSAARAPADADARHRGCEFRFPAPEIPARFAEADVRADPDVRAVAVGADRRADCIRRRAPARRAGRDD